MTPAFKRYLVALARTATTDTDNDALRDEMDDLWDLMTQEEQDVVNDVAKVLVEE